MTPAPASRRSFSAIALPPPMNRAAFFARESWRAATNSMGTPASSSSLPIPCPSLPGPTIATVVSRRAGGVAALIKFLPYASFRGPALFRFSGLPGAFFSQVCNESRFFFAQGLHPVAQFCGLLEFKFLCRLAHLLFQVEDHFLELAVRSDLCRLGLRGNRHVIRLDDFNQSHIDRFDDAFGSDSVLRVVLHLLGAPAVSFSNGLPHGVRHAV